MWNWSTTTRSNAPDSRNSDQGVRRGGPPVVCCKELTYTYPGVERPALEDVGFEVRAGEYVGIVGPNGGGKSTLARLLNGLREPTSGTIRVAGHDPITEPFEVRGKVGVLFQNPDNGLVAPFVEDDVAFGLENLGVARDEMRERVAEAIGAVGLAGYERREPHTLSGGEKQRVALAGLLAVEPEVLVLDEPTSMLDAVGRREVLDRIQNLQGSKTILHVTHHLEELIGADRVLVLNEGRLVADLEPARLFSDARLLRRNQLSLPAVLRISEELGLPPSRQPEKVSQAILERVKRGAEAR